MNCCEKFWKGLMSRTRHEPFPELFKRILSAIPFRRGKISVGQVKPGMSNQLAELLANGRLEQAVVGHHLGGQVF